MKKLKKLNLGNVTVINSNEMKHIIGGYGEPEEYDSGEYIGGGGSDGPGGSGGGYDINGEYKMSAKERACVGKKLAQECSWDTLTTHYGHCSQTAFTPYLFCSDLRPFT